MFDSRIFYLQLGDMHRTRPQVVSVPARRDPRPADPRRARRSGGR
jgi:hypothetical protein